MRVTDEGLFAVGPGEPLTPALFAALVARGEPFAVKTDYRGLPPPIEELDLVHLHPGVPQASASGALFLRTLDDGAFEFTRTTPPAGVVAARVTAVERPGQVERLDSHGWRLLGRCLARSAAFARAFDEVRRLYVRARRPMPPASAPLTLGTPARVIEEVRAKWAASPEVRYTARVAGLEAWEQDVVGRVAAPGARVLIIGCGAGREALALAAEGFRVTGIDFVAALVDVARARAAAAGLPVAFETATAEGLAPRMPAAFDVVVATTPVYEQIPGRARRLTFLRALGALAAARGCIVLCAAWHADRGPRRAVIDGVRWLLGRLGVPGAAEPGDRFTYHVSIASHHATRCFYHRFQRPVEIAREVRAAGLEGDVSPEGPWVLRRAGR